MRPGKRPAAEIGVGIERVAFHDLANGTEMTVLELTDIELPVGFRVFREAQKNIARGLHRALTFDHAAALMDEVWRGRGDLFENRRQRLLDLQEQMLAVRRHEKSDSAKRANAADADDLEGNVGKRVASDKRLPLWKQGRLIISESGMRMNLVALGCEGIEMINQ